MTDRDESRPLTRREMRLREMEAAAAEGGVKEPATEPQEPQEVDGSPHSVSERAAEVLAAANIEIALADESGRMRSRRELRELRAQAESEVLASAGIGLEEETETETVVEAVVEQSEENTEEIVEQATDPFDELEETVEYVPEFEGEENTDEVVAVDVLDEGQSEDDGDIAQELDESALSESELDEPAADAEIEVSEPTTSGYSFPDIAPLDEGRSVFDDPATRLLNSSGSQSAFEAPTGDFDDLISRAVAQEGNTGSSGTSALILPNMPDRDRLSGPLGETGELYITGSIDLPKSLSETGGHSSIHDSVEIEPLDDLGFSEPSPTGSIMAPVSATHAVSMRSNHSPMVTSAANDKSKLPLVLISTGGILAIGAAALIIWAATSGLFG